MEEREELMFYTLWARCDEMSLFLSRWGRAVFWKTRRKRRLQGVQEYETLTQPSGLGRSAATVNHSIGRQKRMPSPWQCSLRITRETSNPDPEKVM